jgi:hypothetical protein
VLIFKEFILYEFRRKNLIKEIDERNKRRENIEMEEEHYKDKQEIRRNNYVIKVKLY